MPIGKTLMVAGIGWKTPVPPENSRFFQEPSRFLPFRQGGVPLQGRHPNMGLLGADLNLFAL